MARRRRREREPTLRGYKGELFEGGVRVPLFAMWPRVRFDAPPPEIELPVAVTDYPTLLAPRVARPSAPTMRRSATATT